MVRAQLFPRKPPGLSLRFSRTGVQHSPGSSTIELPSALAESSAYPPDRALPGSPRQRSLPLACRHLPKATKLELGNGAHLGTRSSTHRTAAASQPTGCQLAASLEGEPGPTPAGKTFPHIPQNQVSDGEGTRLLVAQRLIWDTWPFLSITCDDDTSQPLP